MQFLKNKKKIILPAVMVLLVTVAGLIIIFGRDHVQSDPFAITTGIINILLFTVMLATAVWKYSFSFDMMFWLFNLFFLGYAPMLQHLTNIYALNLRPTVQQVSTTNLLISDIQAQV